MASSTLGFQSGTVTGGGGGGGGVDGSSVYSPCVQTDWRPSAGDGCRARGFFLLNYKPGGPGKRVLLGRSLTILLLEGCSQPYHCCSLPTTTAFAAPGKSTLVAQPLHL